MLHELKAKDKGFREIARETGHFKKYGKKAFEGWRDAGTSCPL